MSRRSGVAAKADDFAHLVPPGIFFIAVSVSKFTNVRPSNALMLKTLELWPGPVGEYSLYMRALEKRFVYVIRSVSNPDHYYVGLTSDVRQRLEWHNAESGGHTARYRPWAISVIVEFADEVRADAFERYLKSGSGRAFAKRHFARSA
jgi:predicted GIY-YIG superfamily endonuclease